VRKIGDVWQAVRTMKSRYASKKSGKSKKRVKRAVKRVGNSRRKVERELRQ